MGRTKWAILCSGWGNNVIDVVNAYSNSKVYKDQFEISVFIYDNAQCGAAEVTKNVGIESLLIPRINFQNSVSHQDKIMNELKKRNIEFIFLMNYKYLIRQAMLKSFYNRIINVHPSLFPSFLATTSAIQDALAYGVKITGITTHIIDDQYDRGIILFQVPIKVKDKDTFDTLYPKFKKKGCKIILKTMKAISKKIEN